MFFKNKVVHLLIGNDHDISVRIDEDNEKMTVNELLDAISRQYDGESSNEIAEAVKNAKSMKMHVDGNEISGETIIGTLPFHNEAMENEIATWLNVIENM